MRKYVLLFTAVAVMSLAFAGCGETLNGISKDIHRQGKGVRTIFVRDEQ